MASTGRDKFLKYFKNIKVSTKIKLGAGKSSTAIYDQSGKSIGSLDNNHPITVLPTTEYSARYLVETTLNNKKIQVYVPESAVAKPIDTTKGATEVLGVQSNTLINGGTYVTMRYGDKEVSGRAFRTAKSLASSIMFGLETNPNVNRDNSGIIEAFEGYFKQTNPSTIKWNAEIPPNEINELGKYIGELLLGYIALKTNSSPFSGTPKEFFVPDDPSFKGVDSFLTTTSGMFPISNKFGVGAKASFFGNLLPTALDNYNKLPSPSVIKDICDVAKSLRITSDNLLNNRGAKQIVYEYGVRKILNLPSKVVKDSYDVYTTIKAGKTTPEIDAVTKVIKSKSSNTAIKSGTPITTTSFFNRTIADQLNADTKSIQYLIEVMAGKGFYQANLNIDKWRKGEISYSITKSDKASLAIIGSKSAINDIEAKQGLINYELKVQ